MTTPQATCPVCDGAGRVSAQGTPYKTVTQGYDPETDTLPCRNCGGQTMSGVATGKVPLRPDGTPCRHEYVSRPVGRFKTFYKCKHCGHEHCIDSY